MQVCDFGLARSIDSKSAFGNEHLTGNIGWLSAFTHWQSLSVCQNTWLLVGTALPSFFVMQNPTVLLLICGAWVASWLNFLVEMHCFKEKAVGNVLIFVCFCDKMMSCAKVGIKCN